MTDVHYIVGEPGVGKSWLMDRLTEGYHRVPFGGQPRREHIYRGWTSPSVPAELAAIELGARVGPHPEGYPGTDAMSMTAIVPTHEWLRGLCESVPVLGEGARLGVKRLAQACLEGPIKHKLHVYHIVDPGRAAAQRLARGSNQKDSWIKGARTRAERFALYVEENMLGDVHHLTCPPEAILTLLRRKTGL